MKKCEIQSLCAKRVELINALDEGQLTKEDFILENYRMMENYQNITTTVESVEEGIIKYHYFNTQAKKLMLEAEALIFRDERQSNRLKEKAYDLYVKKDHVTLKMIELMVYQNMEAYYIHMNSRHLEGQIFEICCHDYEKVVLHSKDRKILHKLRTAGCFVEDRRNSKIETYVNTRL